MHTWVVAMRRARLHISVCDSIACENGRGAGLYVSPGKAGSRIGRGADKCALVRAPCMGLQPGPAAASVTRRSTRKRPSHSYAAQRSKVDTAARPRPRPGFQWPIAQRGGMPFLQKGGRTKYTGREEICAYLSWPARLGGGASPLGRNGRRACEAGPRLMTMQRR